MTNKTEQKTTLLDRALTIKRERPMCKRTYSVEDLDLALAVAKGAVTGTVAMAAIGLKTANAGGLVNYMAQTFRWGVRNGMLVRKEK